MPLLTTHKRVLQISINCLSQLSQQPKKWQQKENLIQGSLQKLEKRILIVKKIEAAANKPT
jgi:hypothetical protein